MKIAKSTGDQEALTADFLSLYKEDRVFQTLVDSVWVDKYENMMFKTYFPLDDMPSSTDTETGMSQYVIKSYKETGATNAIARAKYSELPSEDVDGMDVHTGTLQDYGKGWHMTGAHKATLDRMAKKLGNNDPLFKRYVIKTDKIIKGHYMLLNEMAAQKMSTGRFTNAAYRGLSYDVPVTTVYELSASSRDVACGTKVWDDPTATIVTDIRDLVKEFRDTTGYEGVLSLKMTRDFFVNVFLKNEELKTLVTNMMQADGSIIPTGHMLTEANYNAWNMSMGGYLPSIEFIEQESLIAGSSVITSVNGWKEGIVVLSPAGAQGVTKWAETDEYQGMEGMTNISIASLDGGLLKTMNAIKEMGRLPSYNTEVIGSYEPVLTTWNNHWCINTKKAKS